jgi:hypothetical protein
MKSKSERDCPFCVKEKGKHGSPKPETPTAWGLRKGYGGFERPTAGNFTVGQVVAQQDQDVILPAGQVLNAQARRIHRFQYTKVVKQNTRSICRSNPFFFPFFFPLMEGCIQGASRVLYW